MSARTDQKRRKQEENETQKQWIESSKLPKKWNNKN